MHPAYARWIRFRRLFKKTVISTGLDEKLKRARL